MCRFLQHFKLFPYTTLFRSALFQREPISPLPFFCLFVVCFSSSFKAPKSCSSISSLFLFFAFLFEVRSEEHTSELQSLRHLVFRLLLEKKKKTYIILYI